MTYEILTLEDENQRLRLLPQLGGAIASWDWHTPGADVALLRAWDGESSDRYTLAAFPLLPWSNRLTQGGFAHQGVHYAIAPNRSGEPYPIHGDAWLQEWKVEQIDARQAVLALQSRRHGGNPYEYDAQQRFELRPEGLKITLKATHRGRAPLPYGVGFHPYFPCNELTRLQATATGVWLSGPDPIPIAHSDSLPPGWDYNEPAPVTGANAIDNCFSGWDGLMQVSWPDQRVRLSMEVVENSGYSLLYRLPESTFFAFEPISHPVDAFHMKGRPGLVSLSNGESIRMEVTLRVEKTSANAQ